MTEMSKQEAFDRALKGVRAQGGFAERNGTCVYYDEKTERRCGIGHCFTRAQAMDLQDELDVQGGRQSAIHCRIPAAAAREAGLPVSFLRELQPRHDRAAVHDDVLMFERRMHQLATDYGLNYEAP